VSTGRSKAKLSTVAEMLQKLVVSCQPDMEPGKHISNLLQGLSRYL
jgi:hypothetical protein